MNATVIASTEAHVWYHGYDRRESGEGGEAWITGPFRVVAWTVFLTEESDKNGTQYNFELYPITHGQGEAVFSMLDRESYSIHWADGSVESMDETYDRPISWIKELIKDAQTFGYDDSMLREEMKRIRRRCRTQARKGPAS